VLSRALLGLSTSDRIRTALTASALSRSLVSRFVAGEHQSDAVTRAAHLRDAGLKITIDLLGEDIEDAAAATRTTQAYVQLLRALGEAGLATAAEVSVKLSAVGQALADDGERRSLDNARLICEQAAQVSTTVTLDMEDHTTTDATLAVLAELRRDFPGTGAVLQAYLHRTEADCRDLAYEGSRVRLCKGAYKEPASVAYQGRSQVDRAYVRAMRVLMHGAGYPMLATHDPNLIEIGGALAVRADRAPGTYEYQMLFGIRPEEQRRLAAQGETVRVYLPYGDQWYAYLVRRLAERPANLALLARTLIGDWGNSPSL
jgi:proline dehydrogenase